MDREFMKSFYKNYYMNPQVEAIKDSNEYQEKLNQRYEVESKFTKLLKKFGNELVQVFQQYLDAYADEQEILLEEMYLMGALDREKMLRGII